MSENPSTRWGELIVGALAAGGVKTVVVAPGSRSTPLVVAASKHEAIETFSIIDERSAAFFALGRSKHTGTPTAVVCTSGTAGANMHPAVIEADRSRTPLLICTADRPAELHAAGANQTISQDHLYGDAVRYAPTMPSASSHTNAMRAVRSTVGTAVRRSTDPLPGPVHLNIPFRKPLSPAEPIEWAGSETEAPPTVTTEGGQLSPSDRALDRIQTHLADAARPLLIVGPGCQHARDALLSLAATLDVPTLADPLSGLRFGDKRGARVISGYDGFLDPERISEWPRPDLILRFGARPTSVRLQEYLTSATGAHIAIDPGGEYRDPSFSTSDVITADPAAVASALQDSISPQSGSSWKQRFERVERAYWEFVRQADVPPEAHIIHHTFAAAPDPATVFVSNSMPIRDADRFAERNQQSLTVLGNRGASGIDGITSTALGASSATDDPAVLLTGDLALYHDMNGLLAITRCDVDATIVVLNNDGGGIFQKLPISTIDPPFTEHFRTPHGLDVEQIATLYELPYQDLPAHMFANEIADIMAKGGTTIVEVTIDGAKNHRQRDAFEARVRDAINY